MPIALTDAEGRKQVDHAHPVRKGVRTRVRLIAGGGPASVDMTRSPACNTPPPSSGSRQCVEDPAFPA